MFRWFRNWCGLLILKSLLEAFQVTMVYCFFVSIFLPNQSGSLMRCFFVFARSKWKIYFLQKMGHCFRYLVSLWKIWSCFALQLFRLSFCSSSVGYNGSRICYINDEIVCFILGNTIKFIDIKTKEEQYILSPGDGIQSFAVNSSYECIAFSDEGAETNIFIYEYINLTTPVQKIPGMLKM